MSAHLNDVLWSSDEEDVQVSPKTPNEQHRRQLDLFASDSEEEREETECGKEEEEGEILLSCACGKVSLELVSEPVLRLECCCKDCRRGLQVCHEKGGPVPPAVPSLVYFPNLVKVVRGQSWLENHMLKQGYCTERVTATCW